MTRKPVPKSKKPLTRQPQPKPEVQAKSGPQAKPEPKPKPAARDVGSGLGGAGGFLWALLALAVVAGAGVATSGVWMPKLAKILSSYQAANQAAPVTGQKKQKAQEVAQKTAQETARKKIIAAGRNQPPSGDIKDVVRRLGEMETRLAALRKMVGAARPPEVARAAGESLDRLSGRLEKLERNRREVDAILKRISAIDRSPPGGGKEKPQAVSGEQGLVAAVRLLNRRISGNKPFTGILGRVKKLAGADKDMAAHIALLEPLAPSGVRTIDQLREEFIVTSGAILRSEPLRGGSGWWDRTLNKLAAMVSLRREQGKNTAGGRAVSRAVAAAEAALGKNNITAATSALEALSDAPLAAAEPWLGEARGRQAAEKAAAALNLLALSRLAPATGKDGGKAAKAAGDKAPEKTAAVKKAPSEKSPAEKTPAEKSKE